MGFNDGGLKFMEDSGEGSWVWPSIRVLVKQL